MIVTASGPSRGRENYYPVPRVAVREAIKDLRRRIDADRQELDWLNSIVVRFCYLREERKEAS